MEQAAYHWHILGGASATETTLRLRNRRLELSAQDARGLLSELLAHPLDFTVGLDDFRRGGELVKLAILCGAAAHADARTVPVPDTAVLAWGKAGAWRENLAYWHDYIANGREIGSARLFVGTLPSIPLCEAAIALGLNGPGYYLDAPSGLLPDEAEHLMTDDASLARVLLLIRKGHEMRVFLLGRGEQRTASDAETVRNAAG